MSRSFRVIWGWRAKAIFYKLPTHTATMVDRAVIRFAELGEGQLDWEAPHHLLVAGFYDAVLHIDVEQGVVNVLWIYRAR